MPYIHVKTNTGISAENSRNLKKKLGEAIRLIPGKSEQWLMLSLNGNADMAFAGSEEPCCMVQVDTYGPVEDQAASSFTKSVTDMVENELQVSPDRIYVAYRNTMQWGWNGSNF